MPNSLVLFQFVFLLRCLPPGAGSSQEECAGGTGASRGGDCSNIAHNMALLQRQHGIRLPQADASVDDGAGPVQRKPNIVLFLPDDMYFREYSAWQPSGVAPAFPSRMKLVSSPTENAGVMPRLEKIAQSGVTFTRAYSTSSTCVPSRYSVMTGRYPSHSQYARETYSQIFNNIHNSYVGTASQLSAQFNDTGNTVASALRGLGYLTGMVGKWHLTPSQEASFGDDYSWQTDVVKGSGFDFVDGLYIENMCDCSFPICKTFSHNMEWLLDRALHFMVDALRNERPFFLYFAATPAHLPTVEDSLLGVFGTDATPSGPFRYPDISRYCSSCTFPLRKDIWDSARRISSTSEVGYCRASLAALRWLDESLGVLCDFLSERAAIENTYIVISTDHGSSKKTLYETGIRVPLYAVGPGIRAGTRVDELVSHIDLAPTFLQWAGCCADDKAMPLSFDGLSWSSLASHGVGFLDREGIRAEAFWDRVFVGRDNMKLYTSTTETIFESESLVGLNESTYEAIMFEALQYNLAGIVGDSYPALYEKTQLYNLTADPLEQVNLWSTATGQVYRSSAVPSER